MLANLIEENRVLRRQLGGRRLRAIDYDRRQLAARAYLVGRQALRALKPLSRRTRCSVGTAGSSHANGPTPRKARVVARSSSLKFANWCGRWRRIFLPGATRGFQGAS